MNSIIFLLHEPIHAPPRASIVRVDSLRLQNARGTTTSHPACAAEDHRLASLFETCDFAFDAVKRNIDGACHMSSTEFLRGPHIDYLGAIGEQIGEVNFFSEQIA